MATIQEQTELKEVIVDLIDHAESIGLSETRKILLVALTVLCEECVEFNRKSLTLYNANDNKSILNDINDESKYLRLLIEAQVP